MIFNVIRFLKKDLWRLQLKNYGKRKSLLLRLLRIIVLAVRGFAEDKCKFRASALTFFSLLSIVPVIAMIFGIAKGFGFEKVIEKEILQKMQGQQEVAQKIITFANSMLENAHGGLVAGIGVAFLFWAAIKVLTNIENSFNDIWGIKTPRKFTRKLIDYLALILICPFLLIVSSSITVIISSQIENIIQKVPTMELFWPLISLGLRSLSYTALWVVFSFIFIFIPNTKVKLTSGIIGGIVAGTIFQLVQMLYISFQIGAAKYGAIYGSFAALPLFLIWMQMSWLIILFGAELAFAHQNVDTYEFEQECLSASRAFKKIIALMITTQIVKNFCNEQPPLSDDKIAQIIEAPIRLVRQSLFELAEAKIICQVKTYTKETAYIPAVDVEKITVKYVIAKLEQAGQTDIPVGKKDDFEKIANCLQTFACEIEKSPENSLLKNI